MVKHDCFHIRRQQLLAELPENSIAIVFASKEPKFHRKTIFPFRQDPNFYYLTGFPESEAIAVFIPKRAEGEYVLFTLDKNPDEEVWTGTRVGQEAATNKYGAHQAFSLSEIETIFPDLLVGKETIYFPLDDHEDYERVIHWTKILVGQDRNGINLPTDFIDINKILYEMRLIKDEDEIKTLRKAVNITASAQVRMIKTCKPNIMEYELEAEIQHEFFRHGGRMPSFEPIVASGANTCILHYTHNDQQLKSGNLLLADIGVEYHSYAGDITRTIPINGKFSPEQKAIYEAVLETQLRVIKHIKPGIRWNELQEIAIESITSNLLKLKLLKGKLTDLIATKAYTPFYMHKISHWLGIDVHDVGRYKLNSAWRKLKPGMVLTIEPGIYIAAGLPVDKKWWNIGVRIEDDILVTKNGHEVLSSAAPKTIAEIEQLMRHSSK